ncbi:AraC family transcriptional regulator [Comamonas aquatica]|uniref:AraC family transcriptional regulator n=1 Tax=Comamonas aquatica TaxID=225991 RepID=UPI0022DE4A7D|nr:AraC family transcriptional regulator [Comamonas aquatica]WBM42452.1 AraC family transcriptional regulator [Comamonas aquatica]
MTTPALVPAAAGQHPAFTPIAFVRCVAQAYAQREMEVGVALQQAQIAPALLADDQARITALQMELLCAHAMRELDDEGLGWFQRRLPWGSYGLLARASISSPSLGLAVARWCRHHGLLTDDLALALQVDGPLATIRVQARRDLGVMQEFCLLSVLRNLHGFASWLVDTRLPLRQASFPFPAPAHQAVYGRLFDAPVRFGAAAASLELDAHWLQLPLVRDEAALNTMLQRALPLQVRPYKPAQPLVQRVRQALAAHPQCSHTAATLCAELHLAPRSLHRQLQAHGTSLQALKDAVRRDRALHLLQRTDTPLKRVAQACGFAGEKSFIRAFHQWTGQAPGAYRQAQRGR